MFFGDIVTFLLSDTLIMLLSAAVVTFKYQFYHA